MIITILPKRMVTQLITNQKEILLDQRKTILIGMGKDNWK